MEVKLNKASYIVKIEQDEDGIYTAHCPMLPGCISQGETLAQVKENISEAIQAYLGSMEKHDEN